MVMETWHKMWCDKCGVLNWVCDGDITDMTRPDIDGFICYKCKTSYAFVENDPGFLDNYEIGREEPS